MAGRYGFVSGGAAAGNAIQEFLMQRAMQERQAMLDAAAQQEKRAQAEQQEAELRLRQQQEARVAAAQKATMDDLANQREFQRATTLSENAMPGDMVDDDTRSMLTRQGYGGQMQKTPGIMVPLLGSSAASDAQIQPEGYEMRGGSKYLAAQATAREKAEQAREAERARAEAAEQQREFLASQNEANRANARAIAGATNARIAAEKNDAKAAKDAAQAEKDAEIANTRREIRDLAKSIMDDPALESITGAFDAHTPDLSYASRDLANRWTQLTNKLTLEQRSKLKGQGQVSNWEGEMVGKGASALDRAAGAANARKHLQEIIDALQGDKPNNGPGQPNTNTPPPGGSSFRVVARRPAK